MMASAAGELRQLLQDKNKIIACPGVYDGFTARIALHAGFDALYMVHLSIISPTRLCYKILCVNR